MLWPMSKSMLANPKTALGFAGVTIALAIGASFAADSFLPQSDEPEEVVEISEAGSAAPAAPAPTAAPAATGWADEGLDDDWNVAAGDAASGNGFANSSSSSDAVQQAEFGDFNPQESAENGGERRSQRPARTASGSGPQIRSGAAPGAPPLDAPGNNPSAQLEMAN